METEHLNISSKNEEETAPQQNIKTEHSGEASAESFSEDIVREAEEGRSEFSSLQNQQEKSITDRAKFLGVASEDVLLGFQEKSSDHSRLADSAMEKLKAGLRVLGVALPIAMGQGNALAENSLNAHTPQARGNMDLFVDSSQSLRGTVLEKEKTENEPTPSLDEASLVTRTKSELLAHIGSLDYLEKLVHEFGRNETEAKKIQQIRLKNVEQVDFRFLTPEEMKRRFGADDPKGTRVMAFAPEGENLIYLPLGVPFEELREIARHELEHRATDLNKGIPVETKKILDESFLSYGKGELDGYFKNPTERLVRKQQADFEMERLGIKKYGQLFTEEHYKKLMDIYNQGGLTRNTREFIKTTEPKDFIEIFNTIADNNEKFGSENITLSSNMAAQEIDQAAKRAVENFENNRG